MNFTLLIKSGVIRVVFVSSIKVVYLAESMVTTGSSLKVPFQFVITNGDYFSLSTFFSEDRSFEIGKL